MIAADPDHELRYKPMTYGGSLDHLEFVEVTPIIGREYTKAKIKDILHASNAEEQIRDLAVIISERGVVFFRENQQDLTVDELKEFTDLVGKLSGRPKENGLHVHPLYRDPGNIPMGNGETDENIYVINSEAAKKLYKTMAGKDSKEPKNLSREWHSDATFEICPSDFSCLIMEETPPHGGDTLWCSGYEVYDRISPPMRAFLDTLTATCAQPVFRSACTAGGYEVMSPRGSPLNVGDEFAPVHPVVRTNRQTGWKSIFAGVGLHVTKINDVYEYEDRMIREYIMILITLNHDCVARMHWTKGAAAIWNNSCVWHAATPDTHLVEGAVRTGIRASSIGEQPYLDPASTSRREALGLPRA
ncbi:related to taurine catabolism dioxygenase [Phialocephala subalpina]|uniref:Related to taurine catabolism dioxygenase n=1 Tax=Phialocephala subalpina TaxID=576137 RepID=A0A1L7XNQ9_9HELO|nr:related to taurine catabolism dioxygenase [Phialocephala subalpina]